MIFKKTIIALILSLSSLNANINWHTYKEGFNASLQHKISHKKVFVMVVSENCRYCHKMLKQIKNDIFFQKFIKENFYPILINTSKDFTPVDLDIGVTPSYFILDSKTMEIEEGPIKGFMPTRKLINQMQ